MLDIKFIRENLDLVKDAAQKKHTKVDLDKLVSLDDERRELLQSVESKKAEQNRASDRVVNASDAEKTKLIEEMTTLKESLQKEEAELKKVMKEWQALMLQVPNIPHASAPLGKDEDDNVEIKNWGERTKFDFELKSHIDIMNNLDMVDFERGTKVHGFRGYYLKNEGANLSWAIWNTAREFFMKKGFTEFIAPAICREENYYGTGHLPSGAEDLFQTQDGDMLTGTAEVPMMGYFADEVLENLEGNPIKVLAFTPCFRREAGSYGKDTKGLIRVHEFYKLEQLIICEASHEVSVEMHEWINRNHEEFLEHLGIPYQTVDACTGDMGQGKVRMYDVNAWVPGEEKYREVSSASYFHDFQTRRFNIKYRDKEGKVRLTHSLNCTAIATPRILVSLIENFQQKDGSVKVPEALRKYLGKDVLQ